MDNIIQQKANFNCQHNKYLIDERLNVVECGLCGVELNPMFVLKQLSVQENRYHMRLKHLYELVKKAEKKNRCKCEKCEQFTRIQRG